MLAKVGCVFASLVLEDSRYLTFLYPLFKAEREFLAPGTFCFMFIKVLAFISGAGVNGQEKVESRLFSEKPPKLRKRAA